jgi:hypothetical protein
MQQRRMWSGDKVARDFNFGKRRCELSFTVLLASRGRAVITCRMRDRAGPSAALGVWKEKEILNPVGNGVPIRQLAIPQSSNSTGSCVFFSDAHAV